MTTTTPRATKAARKQHGGVTKKSYSIPVSAAEHAERMAEAEGISTSALVGRAIEERYERTRWLEEAREIASDLLAKAVETHGPVTEEEEAAVDTILAEVKAARA